MVSINTNLTDMIIMSSLNDSTNGINKSIERLTSGYKINHAKDNAANLNIVTNLSTKISSLLQVRNNTEDGISLLSTAQGGLEEISELLSRLRKLLTQAMNGFLSRGAKVTVLEDLCMGANQQMPEIIQQPAYQKAVEAGALRMMTMQQFFRQVLNEKKSQFNMYQNQFGR